QERLAQGDGFADVCFTASTGRAQLEERLAVVAGSGGEARELLGRGLAGETSPRVVPGRGPVSRRAPRLALLFPGQGAQDTRSGGEVGGEGGRGGGRGGEVYGGGGVFRGAVERVAAAVAGELEHGLVEVLYGGRSGALEETAYTQVGLFAVEWALAEQWRAWGV